MTVDARQETRLQPFGAVVLLQEDFTIAHASLNCPQVVGVDAETLIGQPLTAIFSCGDVEQLRGALNESFAAVGWRRLHLKHDGRQLKLHAFDTGGSLLGLDLIPPINDAPGTDAQAVERVAGLTERLGACGSVSELVDVVAKIARERAGYDGAWVTRLDEDGHAVILAGEQHGPSTVVGTRVPADDLPPGQPQVAGRFVPFFIADLQAEPTHLIPAAGLVDLQASALLFPFADYLAALSKIGVRAQASVPIVVDGALWGRVSAAHGKPKRLTAAAQAELAMIGAATGIRLRELLELEAARERVDLARYSSRVVRAMAATTDLVQGLTRDAVALCGVCAADSAVVYVDGKTITLGARLSSEVAEQLVDVATEALRGDDETATATTTFKAQRDASLAAGFLAVRLPPGEHDMVIWTRPERQRQLTWLSHRVSGSGPATLGEGVAPRLERRRGHCPPWSPGQRQQAEELRDAVAEVLVARYGHIQSLADELIRSNEEYDAFAHAAAHDLKAPLRSARINIEFVLEDAQERLRPNEIEQVQTTLRVLDRMSALLDDLLAYAQVGREVWNPRAIRVSDVVAEATELLGHRAETATVTADNAILISDPAALRQVLFNLVGNAIKYSDGPATVQVETTTLGQARQISTPPSAMRAAPPETPVLMVTDAGIGIDPEFHEAIFGLFRQLNPKIEGSGAGLALCRLACRRHGGDIWLNSTQGAGATFFVAPSASEPIAVART